ncbi:acetyl-CoA carboxylase biotin carboxyl carrier protein [Acetitomaculum ruminis]|nr:acetyl-CoA carboxylase biotin carboxyl carrier protein subunit [Acetitomaculum ruminis]
MSTLQEYASLFEKMNLTELQVEEEGLKLTLKRDGIPFKKNEEKENIEKIPVIRENLSETKEENAVKSPLLGIFYLGDGKGNIKNVGDIVAKGDVLCSIEAMKMMNEVRAKKDGIIAEVLVEDGSLVEFDQPLFIIK